MSCPPHLRLQQWREEQANLIEQLTGPVRRVLGCSELRRPRPTVPGPSHTCQHSLCRGCPPLGAAPAEGRAWQLVRRQLQLHSSSQLELLFSGDLLATPLLPPAYPHLDAHCTPAGSIIPHLCPWAPKAARHAVAARAAYADTEPALHACVLERRATLQPGPGRAASGGVAGAAAATAAAAAGRKRFRAGAGHLLGWKGWQGRCWSPAQGAAAESPGPFITG